ncbi:hypothetical protein EDF52_1203 [Curtobacterium sp. PhB42]|nr:hypothetical protein EDF52_1203 [Curtobacterium sp. PhB42]TDW50784.1 hypothetical protein EDF47_1153 [Curtobacterium sp. PhB190]
METRAELEQLRRDPAEWHRRGMHHPDELARIVHRRILHGQAGIVYADFFTPATTNTSGSAPALPRRIA